MTLEQYCTKYGKDYKKNINNFKRMYDRRFFR